MQLVCLLSLACIGVVLGVNYQGGSTGMLSPDSAPMKIAKRAESLIGLLRTEYNAKQVVNYAVFQNKTANFSLSWYKEWGTAVGQLSQVQPGDIVLKHDASYAAVIGTSSNFVFSSKKEGKVISVSNTKLAGHFGSDAIIRRTTSS